MKINIVWIRRDLRLRDHTALSHALSNGLPSLLVFIFDPNILEELPRNDARVSFIHERLLKMNQSLESKGSSILCYHATPLQAWITITQQFDVAHVFVNKDYEPYARERDEEVERFLLQKNIAWHSFKDQVIFEASDVLKSDGKPYTIFTPYKNKWMQILAQRPIEVLAEPQWLNLMPIKQACPKLSDIGFELSPIKVKPFNLTFLSEYKAVRDYPEQDATSYFSPHLRFGTVSIRELIKFTALKHPDFLNELIWREFFMQILFHFPQVLAQNFKPAYDGIEWHNNPEFFDKWCQGKTGYPMVDAGMRELNATGYMHNRVRMVTASFLCKHLLIDWRWGEAYFAKKLLDFELSSNNGNWQWAAGTGCDAAPYFRVFNPTEQQKKFDPQFKYIKKWIPEFGSEQYPKPIVEHAAARILAIETYKKGLKN